MNKADRIKWLLDNAKVMHVPDEKVTYIVCIRIEDAVKVAKGSVLRNCSECKAGVFVQLESIRLAPKATLLCIQCLAARTQGGPS